MQKASKQPQHNPWYKNINIWAWIITGLAIVATIIILSIEDAEEERAKEDARRLEGKAIMSNPNKVLGE